MLRTPGVEDYFIMFAMVGKFSFQLREFIAHSIQLNSIALTILIGEQARYGMGMVNHLITSQRSRTVLTTPAHLRS